MPRNLKPLASEVEAEPRKIAANAVEDSPKVGRFSMGVM